MKVALPRKGDHRFWHPFFCLFPRVVTDKHSGRYLVWLAYVERRRVSRTWVDEEDWEYRLP